MKLAAVQVRGIIGMNRKLKDTLQMLKLTKKNTCVILDDTPNLLGMLIKVKDYITWGEIDKETFRLLLEKRGRLVGNKKITENYLKEKLKIGYSEFAEYFFSGKNKLKDVPGLKPFFRLNPPIRGFEKNGIKKPFSLGGALGYRKLDINNLLRRML